MTGRYRLVESIGQGGMGRVWRATDEVLDRQVAVKEMRIDGLDPEDTRTRRERTLREARATARIDHPHVVRVYDVVDEGELLWIVMELVVGRSLERLLAEEGPLGPRETARIGLGLVTALRQVHAGGVLHRDIKPGNVLVEGPPGQGTRGAATGARRVVLTDFGIAAIQDTKALTMVGMLVGSPDYMAPERISGRPQGPPSDLWSLGATLCAALGGRSPFSRDTTLATLHAVLYEEPRLPPRAGPLNDILAALLEKEPAARPTLTDLESALAPLAFPPPAPTPAVPGQTGTGDAGGTGAPGAEGGAPADRAGAPHAHTPVGPAQAGTGAAGTAAGTGATGATGAGAASELRSESGSEPPSEGPPADPRVRPGISLARPRQAPEPRPAPEQCPAPGTRPAPDTSGAPEPHPVREPYGVPEADGADPVPSPDAPTRRVRGRPGGEPPGPAVAARSATVRSGGGGPGGDGEATGGGGGRRPGRGGGPARRRTGAVVAVGVLVVGTVLAIVLASPPGSHDGDDQSGGASPEPSVLTTANPGSGSGSGPVDPASPTVEGTFRPPSLPPGAHQEAGGYAWATPAGWRRDVKTGAEVHYTSPDGTQELVARSSLARGDLMDTWRTSEENARQGRDYTKIRLEETTFRGRPAVVWEYTFTLRGTPWHARLLGFDEDGKSYQVNTWYRPGTEAQALRTYEKVKDSFTVM